MGGRLPAGVGGFFHVSGSRHGDPLRVLDERFARGEISEEEYRERKRVLEHR